MSTRTFRGTRAWVVGASSGIGAALAAELADRGASVAISARRADLLDDVAAGRMTVVPLDVTDTAGFRRAADEVRSRLGGLDLVVLNAGIWQQLRLADLDVDAIRAQFEVNVMGTMNGVAAVIGEMLDRGRGTIAIMASVAGYRGLPGSLAYGGTKAALINMAEALRAEASAAGVRVVTINPGFVRSPLTARNRFPMPFLIDAEEAARPIADGLADPRRQEIVFPLPMAMLMKLARLLPVRVWTAFGRRMAGPPRKPVPGQESAGDAGGTERRPAGR